MGGSAGGGYPYNNAFRQEIRLTDKPQRLLFIDKGAYPSYEDSSVTLPYWEKVRHSFSEMRGGKRYFRSYLCPKGADRKASCRSCTMQYDEDDPRVSSRRIKYFPVVSLEYWFKITNKYNDEIWVLPSTPAERRKYESDPNATEVFGRLGYIALGNGHFNQLMDIIDHVGQQCVNCMEPGQRPAKLFPAKYTCGFCEHTLCDLETTELSGDELKSFPYRRHQCPACGQSGLPEVIHECERCTEPQPAELFDVVLPLAKRGENTNSMVLIPHDEQITFIDDTTIADNQQLFDGENFNPLIAPLYEALDFDKIFEVEMREDYQDQRVF